MSTDVLYPILIVLGCLVVVVAVHLLTRPRPSRADIRVPDSPAGQPDESAPTRRQLEAWHRDHESSLLDYLDAHDPAPASTISVDEAGERLKHAIDGHPAPEMRAELAALRAAGDSLESAREREDSDAVDRHRDLYLQYRTAWLERLRQFSVDDVRVRATQGRELDS